MDQPLEILRTFLEKRENFKKNLKFMEETKKIVKGQDAQELFVKLRKQIDQLFIVNCVKKKIKYRIDQNYLSIYKLAK